MKSIILSGFMGCGKTTIGKLLSKDLHIKLIDTDELFEQSAKMKISDFFKLYGENQFRIKEAEILNSLPKDDCIISTGGGALLKKENFDICNSIGTIIFIDTPFELCYQRIKNDKTRPLALSKTENELKNLYDERYELYCKHCNYKIQNVTEANDTVLNIKKLLHLI